LGRHAVRVTGGFFLVSLSNIASERRPDKMVVFPGMRGIVENGDIDRPRFELITNLSLASFARPSWDSPFRVVLKLLRFPPHLLLAHKKGLAYFHVLFAFGHFLKTSPNRWHIGPMTIVMDTCLFHSIPTKCNQ